MRVATTVEASQQSWQHTCEFVVEAEKLIIRSSEPLRRRVAAVEAGASARSGSEPEARRWRPPTAAHRDMNYRLTCPLHPIRA